MMTPEARRAIRQSHSYMRPKERQEYETENYVATPPALLITDAGNNVWTLGYRYATTQDSPKGEYCFCVLRNGIDTGEFASRIERRFGKVRIFTATGFKTWTGTSFL